MMDVAVTSKKWPCQTFEKPVFCYSVSGRFRTIYGGVARVAAAADADAVAAVSVVSTISDVSIVAAADASVAAAAFAAAFDGN